MPCCGLTPFEVPRTDRMTGDLALVTCARICTRCAARLVRDEHGGWARADEPERGRNRCPDGGGFWAFHEVAGDEPQANPAPAGEE